VVLRRFDASRLQGFKASRLRRFKASNKGASKMSKIDLDLIRQIAWLYLKRYRLQHDEIPSCYEDISNGNGIYDALNVGQVLFMAAEVARVGIVDDEEYYFLREGLLTAITPSDVDTVLGEIIYSVTSVVGRDPQSYRNVGENKRQKI
jgi:hypothetical protein